ncbi:MAG: phosphatidylglycerol lysyltransferase domain-containing protein [Candidatus Symbiothrix sp.]|jgi:hypothetical protein|nr:phosphatidylglycerol lysyltransferase domain-containing protein [Candidatus Symbiothrix sp.]
MLDFKPVTIEDKDAIQSFFDQSTFRNCDFSFSNIFCWRHSYDTTFAVENGWLYIRFQAKNDKPGYLFPLCQPLSSAPSPQGEGVTPFPCGEGLGHALERIMRDAERRNEAVRLYAVTREMFEQIEQAMPGKFTFQTDRAWFEYLYRSEDLISLVGKKYQSKRNHINKFKRMYPDWEYLPVTRAIIPDCLKLYDRWCSENGDCNDPSLQEEHLATKKAFAEYEKLGLIGGALRINGEILAYSYGQALTTDTFGVYAEKSLYEIDGGFTMMNQQFAEHNCANYTYINREEDLGIESLRKAKESYQPDFLLEKGFVILKES